MTLLATYNFEGQTPGANATASSPFRLSSGSTNIVVATAAAVHGTVGGRISAAASFKAIIWDEAQTTATRIDDVYFILRAISANGTVMALYDDATSRGDVRINAARTVTIRNGTTATATSTEVLALDTLYRFSWRTSNTGQELRVYLGESTTALFTLTGALTNNLHTGVAAGLPSASAGLSIDFDTFRIADDWLAPVNPSAPLATPTSWTFVPDATDVEILAGWSTVAGAATYEMEVQELVASVWTPLTVLTMSGPPRTLTAADGLEASGTYRARLRAMPA